MSLNGGFHTQVCNIAKICNFKRKIPGQGTEYVLMLIV